MSFCKKINSIVHRQITLSKFAGQTTQFCTRRKPLLMIELLLLFSETLKIVLSVQRKVGLTKIL